MITGLFQLLDVLIRLFIWAIIISAVLSILASAGVLDTRNRLVASITDFLYRVTDPVLRPVRNVIPYFGNFDLSPLIVILVLEYLARPLLRAVYTGIVFGDWSPVFL